MSLVNLRGVRLSFGSGQLLDGIDLNIKSGERACLVGRNGTGKSSLLRILHGDQQPDEGEVHVQGNTRISYLPQDVPSDITGSVESVVSSWLKKRSGPDDDWETQHTVGRILSHLHLDAHSEFEELSGGQKRRTLLARALACEPDLLLLDEPTNHLDIDSIRWLEEFLLRHCKTFLFVTHDRAFLRRVANRIIDLDRGKLAHWSCDYDTFLKRKADLMHDEEVRQTVFDKKLSKEELWIRQGIKARRTRDEGRVRQLMQMREERDARRSSDGKANINIQDAQRSGRKVIEAKDISFSYDGNNQIVSNFSATILRGDKIGVIGPNGSGKTTLLKLFTSELEPESGEIIHGTKLEIAYFDQHRAVLDDEKSVADNIGRGMDTITINGRERHVISYLQDFLFTPERAKTPVKVLSGGERNRLLLAMLFACPSNLLVMDEPTNDLDTETLELLEEQLMDYQGTILMVSHDRAFLDNVVTSLIVMEGSGSLKEYVGGYNDYERVIAAAEPKTKEVKKASVRKRADGKRFGFNEKREFESLPQKIEDLEAEQEDLHKKMLLPDYYSKEPSEIATDTQRAAQIVDELNIAYSRWEELELLRDSS